MKHTYFGCTVDHSPTADKEGPQPVLDADGKQIGTRWGLPDGHTGWDETVTAPDGTVLGTFHNLGQAIECARAYQAKQTAKPPDSAATGGGPPPSGDKDVSAVGSGVKTETLLETKP